MANTVRKNYPVTGMGCAACVARVQKALQQSAGVHQAEVSLASNSARIDYDPQITSPAALRQCVQDAGYDLIVPEEDGEDFVEFIREFSIACRRAGLISSVDNYVPYNFNDYVDLEEQAAFADYVVIMGYDEHFAGSQEPGSVASIGYVEYGIEEALREVPAEQLINGIPFYTRAWTTKDGEVTSQVLDMVEAEAFLSDHKMEKEWNSTAQQYYAEKESGSRFYQIWLEDARSIGCKLDVMKENDLAGMAVWVLGLETNDVWDVIEEYVKKQ